MSNTYNFTLSISEAAARGVASIVHTAENGDVVVLERRHEPIAAVIGLSHYERLREAERDLRDIGVVLSRAATDDGVRHALSDVITQFGFDRDALEAELEDDAATGLE